MKKINELVYSIEKELIDLRRKFHKHPELGWLEFYTTTEIINYLKELGYEIKKKEEFLKRETRQGLPSKENFEKSYQRARNWGTAPELLDEIKDGMTGTAALLDTKKEGPTTAFRFDIDAIGSQESKEKSHKPVKEDFASMNPSAVHSCGHDGHIAIGLGLAKILKELAEQDKLSGKIILIFQPAEEGVRGGKAVAESDILNNVDYLLSGHIGMNIDDSNSIICGITGSLFTKKIDIEILGQPSHAGGAPEKGSNALLAANNLISSLYSLNQHGGGMSRINVGKMTAGSYRNLIPAHAELEMEIRGENEEVISYLDKRVKKAASGIEDIYDVKVKLKTVGEAISVESDQKLINIVKEAAQDIEEIDKIIDKKSLQGSEDASFLMEKVKKHGGKACYINFGTKLTAGHHQNDFDFDEQVLTRAVKVYLNCLQKLGNIINI